jgi:cephalosporin hydroxylase
MAKEATKLILLVAAGLALVGVHAATAALPVSTNGTMVDAVAGIDVDENGSINAQEWYVAGLRTFRALDSDKDGKISADEYALIHHAIFAVMDTNHDGEVTVAEAAAYQRLPWTLGMFR